MTEPHRRHDLILLLPHDGEQVTWCDCDPTEDGDGQPYIRSDLVLRALEGDSGAVLQITDALRRRGATPESP
jgi:hypothetical protein